MKNITKGFIGPTGIFVRVTNICFEETDATEIVAESICRDIEQCTKLKEEIKQRMKINDHIYQMYLVEHFGYIYVEMNEKKEILNMIAPKNIDRINQLQKSRLLGLCMINDDIKEQIKLFFLQR